MQVFLCIFSGQITKLHSKVCKQQCYLWQNLESLARIETSLRKRYHGDTKVIFIPEMIILIKLICNQTYNWQSILSFFLQCIINVERKHLQHWCECCFMLICLIARILFWFENTLSGLNCGRYIPLHLSLLSVNFES